MSFNQYKKITRTFLSGRLSSTLIIPIETARKYGIDQPSNVIIHVFYEISLFLKFISNFYF